jgi:hypothetical protein
MGFYMKNLIKIAALTGSLLAASFVNAGVITINYNATASDETNLQAIMNQSITEDFNPLASITCEALPCTPMVASEFLLAGNSLGTSVGTFTQVENDGTASDELLTLNQLLIEDSSTGEFGRQSLQAQLGVVNWLDTNDSDVIRWDIDASFLVNSFGFYLSDANDQGAVLELVLSNGVVITSSTLNANLGNGNVAYIRYVGDEGTSIVGASLKFNNFGLNGGSENDGMGIANVTIGYVSAPHTLLLLSLSILGLISLRKRV